MKTSVRRQMTGSLILATLLGSGLWLMIAGARPAPRRVFSFQNPSHPVFSNSTALTNPYLPLTRLHRDVLEGVDEGKSTRIVRIMQPGTRRFVLDGQPVMARIMEDREYVGGKLSEVALDYFAQADDGSVYYLGEKVDTYRNGKVVGHAGAWLAGEHNAGPGLMMPAHPKLGEKYYSENVPRITVESDEIVAIDATVTVPAGTYHHCMKVKEGASGEGSEYKYYAPNVGVVEEVPQGGKVLLISHS